MAGVASPRGDQSRIYIAPPTPTGCCLLLGRGWKTSRPSWATRPVLESLFHPDNKNPGGARGVLVATAEVGLDPAQCTGGDLACREVREAEQFCGASSIRCRRWS